MAETIVSLSTIPPRFGGLSPTLTSLLGQNPPVREIRLNIPMTYRRFPDWDGRLPEVPEGVTIHRCAEDLGPAAKILPTAKALRGEEVDLLFCDDDKIYDPGWHARFKAQAALRPGCCIVEAGENFPDIDDDQRPPDRKPRMKRRPKGLAYRLMRLASLTLYKPEQYLHGGHVDQISGWAGVLVRPDWFDDEAFDIPGVLWTVDDVWLSGHLERRGIPIWLNLPPRPAGFVAMGRTHALLDHVEEGQGRVAADLAAIAHFRTRYGIWPKSGEAKGRLKSMTRSMRALARLRREEVAALKAAAEAGARRG